MKIAIQGLGRMGGQIAQKIAESQKHTVVAWDIKEELVKEAEQNRIIGAYAREEVLNNFKNERVVIWLMLAADLVQQEAKQWSKILPKGSIIIDGGNSNFCDTQELNQEMKAAGMYFMDIGVSGGIHGYKRGFAMMCGTDDKTVYEEITPILDILAKPGGKHALIGKSGAGHYVKMIHNAIEYGMMQSLAEGYQLLHDHPFGKNRLNLAAATDIWRHHSVIDGWLNDLASDIITKNPDLEGINGYVAENGEARWALEASKSQKVDMPAIQTAVDIRRKSRQGEVSYATKLLAALRYEFGGHNLNGE